MMWKGDGTLRHFFVYIMSNNSMTLYTGVTNDVIKRAMEHKNGMGSEFTTRYHFALPSSMPSRVRSRSKD